jgi:hypothetical protein
MFTARAFCMTRRKAGFEEGSGPPDLTAMVMSFAIRANCFAMRFHRANIVCFLTSNMRPMLRMVTLSTAASNKKKASAGRPALASYEGQTPRISGELGADHPQATTLRPQAGLDLNQPLLKG